MILEHGARFILDVELMDIRTTVARTSENIVRSGASFFNIHALGGGEMMKASAEAAKKAAAETGSELPTVLAVTILSSINDDILNNQLKIPHSAESYVPELAKLAKDNGIDGVVASVWEARKIKEVCGKDFKVLCPGIRPVWASKDDQKRLATPSKAIEEGAD